MSPYERVEALYLDSPEAQPFAWYVDHHHRHGFVFSRPDFFVMGRPVVRHSHPDLICEPTHLFPVADCDCWFIFAMAGNMAAAWDILPWPLPWFAWERELGRKRDLRFYPLARIREFSHPVTELLPRCAPQISGHPTHSVSRAGAAAAKLQPSSPHLSQ